MKTSNKLSVLAACMLFGAKLSAQSDSLGLPGDNLDLNAVLSIFKQSTTVEDFEKRLNAADSKVNNLDLNGDEQVDYLRVVDYGKDDFHSIVIQDPVSKSESQDVAVIEIVKKDDKTAHIQIVGDETLYGKNYIIEPKDQPEISLKDEDKTSDDVYAQPTSKKSSNVTINVWGWPSVAYIYSPGYSYWVSPWYWGYYPGWYSPWRPYRWHAYHGFFVGYNYGFYGCRTRVYAFPHAHNYYYGKRMQSSYVQKTSSNYGQRNRIDNGGQQRINHSRRPGGSGDNQRINNRNSNSGQRERQGGTDRVNNNSGQRRGGGEHRMQSSPRGNMGGGVRSGGGHSGGVGGHRR